MYPKPSYKRKCLLFFCRLVEKDLRLLSDKDLALVGSKLLMFNLFFSFLIGRRRFRYLHFTSKIVADDKLFVTDSGSKNLILSFASSPGIYIQCENGVELSSSVLLAPKVSIISANHDTASKDWGHNTGEGITIEKNSWLGSSCLILPGASIGSGCIIGAGSIVTKAITCGSTVIGVNSVIDPKSRVIDV